MRYVVALIVWCFHLTGHAQVAAKFVSPRINPEDRYLFYLHGGIVQDLGPNAVSPDYGPYLYYSILDSLKGRGFHVISEVRPKGTDVRIYANKLAKQIDTLLMNHVPPENITIVGASLGAYITIEAAHLLGNSRIKYVVMALCNEYNLNNYAKYQKNLCGNFLSIYEASDQKGSCNKLLLDKTCKSGYKEIQLNMGNGHGFIFKPYSEWINPLTKWIKQK